MGKTIENRVFILFFAFGAIVLGLVYGVHSHFYASSAQKMALENGIKKSQEREKVFKSFLNSIENELNSINNSKIFRDYQNKINETYIQDYLISMLKTKEDVRVLKIFDKNGKEKIYLSRDNRLHINNTKTFHISGDNKLFFDAKTSKNEKIFFSDIVLSIKNNQIQKPYKPLIYAVLPLYSGGEFDGAIMMGVSMEMFFSTFINAPLYDMMIIDKNQNTLIHYNSEKSWSKYRDEDINIDIDTETIHNIMHNRVYKNSSLVSRKLNINLQEELYLILKLNHRYITKQNSLQNEQYIVVGAIVLFAIIIFALSMHNMIKSQHLQLVNIEKLNEKLEEDVSKKLEDIREKEQVLMQQSRLASMGEMIGAIAHQWRQPLNVISIKKDGLMDEYFEGELTEESAQKYDNDISHMIEYMSKTIDDFRNFYAPQKQKKDFDLLIEIDNVLKIANPQLKSNHIKIDIENFAHNDIIMHGYNNELNQVLINLINNAKDVIVEKKIDNGLIKIELFDFDNEVKINVIDNGGGIDDKIIDKLFEPYFTTKFESLGTGLGLYMSKNIVEKSMNGKIYASNVDNGAKFSILLQKSVKK
jgi:signal transduction histidine kinase